MARNPRVNRNRYNGGSRYRNSEVASAQDKVARAERHYGYALRAFKAEVAAGGDDSTEFEIAKETLEIASESLKRASRLERLHRLKQIKDAMRKLAEQYVKIAKLSKRHGADFQFHLLYGIERTRAKIFGELKSEFEELNLDISEIDPGDIPKYFADLEVRHAVLQDRSAYWFKMSVDATKPWGLA